MRWVGAGVAVSLFVAMTVGAYLASVKGWGLPGMLDQPVSVRQQSVSGARRSGPMFIYFGSHRRHMGGGFHGGK